MTFYNKDANFLLELQEILSKDRDFREFKESFKGFDYREIVQMYVAKNAMEIKEVNDIDASKTDKVDMLESIGEFLSKVKKLDEMRKTYNEDVLKKTEYSLGNEYKNPLIITKKEIKKEFDIKENSMISTEDLNMKLIFWENRVTKTLESVKSSMIANYTALYKKDSRETKRNLSKMERCTITYNENFYDVYKKFLNKEITQKEFEQTDEFKKVEKEIKINNENTGFNYSPYTILNNTIISQQIGRSYLSKDIYIKNNLVKENKQLDTTIYKDKSKENFVVVGMKNKEYNAEVDVHYKKSDYELFKDSVKILEKDENAKKAPIKSVILYKFGEEKLKNLKNAIDNKKDYDGYTQKILNHYSEILEYKNEKEKDNKDKKKENFYKDLQGRRNKNPKYKNDRNKEYRNRNKNRDRNRKNNVEVERGDR